MPLNIRSEEVNRLAEELATKNRVSKTEAVRLALVHELENDQSSVLEKIRPLQDELARYPRTGLDTDKAFYDSLNDE